MNGEKQRKEWKKVKKKERPGNDIVSANGMEDADASSLRECHQGEYKPPIVPENTQPPELTFTQVAFAAT